MKKIATKTDYAAIVWVSTLCALVVGMIAFETVHADTMVTSQMGPGSTGAQVTALQTFLAADTSIYPEGLVTGYYGDLTIAAVQRFQCKYGVVCQGTPTSTGYGLVGPATLAKIEIQEGLNPGGVSLPPTGYPSGSSDVNAPVLSAPTVVTTATTAVIHWNTSETARNSVLYSPYAPTTLSGESLAAMQRVVDPNMGTSPSVTLINLAPNTTYYYVLESVDASGNIQYAVRYSFKTNA